MKGWQIWISATTVALVTAGISVDSRPMITQQPACLHGADEAPSEQARRQQALRAARQINTAQSAAFSQASAYQPLDRLAPAPVVPQGFAVHLATDGVRYVFSVKDVLDACGFAYFSDENGLIYSGEALR